MLKNESERDGGQNTIKREQRVKGTDLVTGGERAVGVHVYHIMKG